MALGPRENPLKLSYTTSIVQNSQEAQEIANPVTQMWFT